MFGGPLQDPGQRPRLQPGGQALTHLVQVLQGQHDLAPVHAHLSLFEVLALIEVGEHLASTHIVWGWNGGWEATLTERPHLPPWPPGGQGPALTQDEVQLGIRLEGVVQRNQEGGLAHEFQHGALGARVLLRLGTLHQRRLAQDLHGIQLPGIVPDCLPHQEHLPVGYASGE